MKLAGFLRRHCIRELVHARVVPQHALENRRFSLPRRNAAGAGAPAFCSGHAVDLADDLHRPLNLGEEQCGGDARLQLSLGRHGRGAAVKKEKHWFSPKRLHVSNTLHLRTASNS